MVCLSLFELVHVLVLALHQVRGRLFVWICGVAGQVLRLALAFNRYGHVPSAPARGLAGVERGGR